MTLDCAKKNYVYEIVGFAKVTDESGQKTLRRFFELGFCVGQRVKIVAESLAKKVFLIEIRGYVLSVRTSLLKQISVVECFSKNFQKT